MSIQMIYKDDDYEITSLMFTNENIRYSLEHLCSIRLDKSKRTFPIVLFSISLLFTFIGFFIDEGIDDYLKLIGCIGVISSFVIFIFRKPLHKVTLVFSSGEKEILENADYKYLEVITEAFSTSIKFRER